jgi:hypothetical protein
MALTFGRYRYNHFRGDAGNYYTIEIYKRDYKDVEPNGDTTLYPPLANEREFSNNNSFIAVWDGANTPGWSWDSSFGGSARHTTGNSDELVYQLDNNLLTAGAQYMVEIDLRSVQGGSIRVELGTAGTAQFDESGVHTEIVTANGGQLKLDPSGSFNGNVAEIKLYRYFAPAEEFDTQGEGFSVTWNGQGGTRNRQFLASECKINYLVKDTATEDFLYEATSGSVKDYFVRIYRSVFPFVPPQGTSPSSIFWYGYLMPSFDALENAPFPYVFQLTANDSYGLFGKEAAKIFADEEEKTERHSIKNILRTLLTEMDLGSIAAEDQWDMTTNMDWWQSSDIYGAFNPVTKYHVAKGFVTKPTTLNDDGSVNLNDKPYEYKAIDVLNGVIKALNMVGFQSGGSYWFIQPNSFINDTTGELTRYRFKLAGGFPDPLGALTSSLLLVINNTHTDFSNEILSGSTITYEPALKDVKINYEPGFSNFSIGAGQDLTTEFYAGSVQTGAGHFNLEFEAQLKENLDQDDFNFNAPVSGVSWTFIDSCFLSTGVLTIKVTDGTQTKYLVSVNGQLEWVSYSASIGLYRGYNAPTDNAVNNSGQMAIGLVQDNIPTNQGGNSTGPCQRYFVGGGTNREANTIFHFGGIVQDPGFSGDIFIEFDATNNYFQAVRDNPGGLSPSYTWTYDDVNNPTLNSSSCRAINITLVPTSQNNSEAADVSNGIMYSASQSTIGAYESEDLGNIRLGRNVANLMYSIQYNSNPTGTAAWKSISDFQRGNPTPDNPKNPTQLLIGEYLQMGTKPLEILQATIRSKYIDPSKVLSYSINDDGNKKYYMFMGGTFSAASETMSGEWFKISETGQNVIIDETPVTTGPTNPQDPEGPTFEGKATLGLNITENTLANNALGFTNATINHSTTYNKINFDSNTRGKVIDNQKLVLSFPDGTNQLVVTANGGNETSESGIDVDSFTPNISYPAGSILRPLIYDFTNVITGGSSLENLYQGITTTYINLAANEFHITSSTSFNMYTRDKVGSVQPTAFVNRAKIYATCFIPLGYEVTAIDIYASVNRNIEVLTGKTINDSTSSHGTGTSNTTLTLSAAWESVANNYLILSFEQGASTDEIYGAKITIAAV